MDNGFYAATSGGLTNARQLDIVSNNLANLNTVGFKAQRLVTRQQEFSDTLAAQLPEQAGGIADAVQKTPGVVDVGTFTDFTPGPIQQTNNPLHVALQDADQFFSIQTDDGITYSRAGNFTLDVDGSLVTMDGKPVQGDGGPIVLGEGSPRITSAGHVIVDEEIVGKLQVVRFNDADQLNQLQRQEGTRFKLPDGATPPTAVENYVLATQSVEMPNVNVVEAMVDMIAANRAFEAYQKTARTIDDLNDRAIRSGRLNA